MSLSSPSAFLSISKSITQTQAGSCAFEKQRPLKCEAKLPMVERMLSATNEQKEAEKKSVTRPQVLLSFNFPIPFFAKSPPPLVKLYNGTKWQQPPSSKTLYQQAAPA